MLQPGDTVTLFFEAKVKKDAANLYDLANLVVVNAMYFTGEEDTSVPEKQDEDRIELPGVPEAKVAKIADRTTGAVLKEGRYQNEKITGSYENGSKIVFTITVTNSGSADLYDLKVRDVMEERLMSALEPDTVLFQEGNYTTSQGDSVKTERTSPLHLILDHLNAGDSVDLKLHATVAKQAGDLFRLENKVYVTGHYRKGNETCLQEYEEESSVSGHTYVDFADFGIRDELAYAAMLRQLGEQFAGRLRVAVGLEHDWYYPVRHREAFDYIIGSVHEIQSPETGRRYIIDGPASFAEACRDEAFGGDGLAMARRFYEITADNAEQYRPDIIGHFDLIVKNNADGRLFDESDRRYRQAALESLSRCLDTGAVFELNTGGIFRKYRSTPYPADFLLRELQQRKARMTVNADAHETAALRFWFSEALELLETVGFRSIWVWENGGFRECGLRDLQR